MRSGPRKPSIIVTAGPTREKIDPVRFLSNYSTGTFGYEIAKAAKAAGNRVILISGPTAIEPPEGVKFIGVESALEMRKAVLKEFKKAGCLIMAAAVSDWRVVKIARQKIRRARGRKRIELIANPDILAEAGRVKGSRVLVGFALETENLETNALRKLLDKKIDLVIANRHNRRREAFGDNKTTVVMIDRYGNRRVLRNKTKQELAKIILDRALSINI